LSDSETETTVVGTVIYLSDSETETETEVFVVVYVVGTLKGHQYHLRLRNEKVICWEN
jgi:hypothetical protein